MQQTYVRRQYGRTAFLAAATLATATLVAALSPAAAGSRPSVRPTRTRTSIQPTHTPHHVCLAWKFDRHPVCTRWGWQR